MRARTARQLRIVVGVTLVSAAVGAVFTARHGPASAGIAVGTVIGGLNGLVLCSVEMFLQGRGAATLRRLPVLLALGLRTVLYGVVFFGTTAAVNAALGLLPPQPALAEASTITGPSLLFSFGIALAINLVFMLRALLGTRALMSLLTGRYHHPREEERVVLFLDLRGSTHLAERLGDKAFHRFLNRVFFDITDPVLEAGGEIYRYVGDEIIVTWPLEKGAENAACVACLFAIEDALARRRDGYLRAFGAAPRLRGALHAGPLIIGEMGDVKREIVMLGDTMNTAARIEEACRTTGHDYIASASLLQAAASLPPGVRAESLGAIPLRGKAGGIELFALLRR